MKSIKKCIWISIIGLAASLTFQPVAAVAADKCVPDKISTSKFAIHPGQAMGLESNGVLIGEPCSATDPGYVVLDYSDRVTGASETLTITDTNSWKWKNFTYEDLAKMMALVGIKEKIDAQKLLSVFYYRIKDGKVDIQNATATVAIVLDPTPAGPCHPDLVSFKGDTISLTSSLVEILDGVETPIQCSDYDPGWVAFGIQEPGSTTVSLVKAYFDKWRWGGEIDYKWVKTMLEYGNFDLSKIEKGSRFELRFFRGGTPAATLENVENYSFVFSFIINMPTSEEIAAAEKAVADQKLAAEAKAIADKKAADEKAAAEKAAAAKAAATKASANKKTTITCIKGKVIKKVTAVNPKCPSGYMKK